MTETADLRVAKLDIKCTRGKRFQLVLVYEDVDISGYTFDFRVRTSKGDGAADLLAGTIASGHVTAVFGSPDTTVTITFTAAEMALAPADYPWEIEPTGGGVKDPTLAIQGTFTVEPEFTL
jgi:hypothetical protein